VQLESPHRRTSDEAPVTALGGSLGTRESERSIRKTNSSSGAAHSAIRL